MVYIDPLSIEFHVKGNKWTTSLAKSQTKVTNIDQLKLITALNPHTHSLHIEEKEDMYEFSFTIPENVKMWKTLKELERNDKLRALHNISTLLPMAKTRITYMIHPNNIT
ncbi:MAG TPA: type VII secretion protein EssB/YukC, partial [Bacillota bacterium]|nr:type VII secretion protein EssB/YukC [Bacillota bacterium]